MNKSLEVFINQIKIGCLYENSGIWGFEYDKNWVNKEYAYPISPSLPLCDKRIVDSASHRPVQWFFDNLLPEEGSRAILAKESNMKITDTWGLLTYYGAESAGAITLLPINTKIEKNGYQYLSENSLVNRIRDLPKHSLSHHSPKRMSLAGAQHKLAIIYKDSKIYEPIGETPSTHILKPNGTLDGYPNTAINEYFCMRLAKELDLSVPKAYFLNSPLSVYIIERFDRDESNGETKRVHAIDATQLLSLDKSMKYHLSSVETLKSCISFCRKKQQAQQQIFKWIIFNILIGNSDAHLKNISFFVKNDGINLAPFYDLVSTAIYNTKEFDNSWYHFPDIELSMPIENTRFFSDINYEILFLCGKNLGVSENVIDKIISNLTLNIEKKANSIYIELESSLDPGESRILRKIINIPIKEMVSKINTTYQNSLDFS